MKAKLLLDFISVGWAFHDCLTVEATQGTTLKCVLAVQNLLVFEQIWDRRWQPCLRCWLPACDQGSFSVECNCSEPPASPLNTYHRAEMAENVSIMGPLKCHCLSLQRGAFALMELLRPILDAKILLMVIFQTNSWFLSHFLSFFKFNLQKKVCSNSAVRPFSVADSELVAFNENEWNQFHALQTGAFRGWLMNTGRSEVAEIEVNWHLLLVLA